MTSVRLRVDHSTGAHIHATVFAGPDADHRANCGQLILRPSEYEYLRATLDNGLRNPSSALEAVTQLRYVEVVFDVYWRADSPDAVFWRRWPAEEGPWRAFAICSDWFAWATADAEEILPEDVPLLRSCADDLLAIEREKPEHRNDSVATAYLSQLFASRKRKLRPMSACYQDKDAMGPQVAALFDAAGPERTDEGKRS